MSPGDKRGNNSSIQLSTALPAGTNKIMARGAARLCTKLIMLSHLAKRGAKSPADAISESTADKSRFQIAISYPFSAIFNAKAEPIVPVPINPMLACVMTFSKIIISLENSNLRIHFTENDGN